MQVSVKIDETIEEIQVEVYTKELNEEVNSILDKLYEKKVTLKGTYDNKVHLLNPSKIYEIYSENKKIIARQKEKLFMLKYTLHELEELLKSENFIRISNSAIVNISYIESFEAMHNGILCINFNDNTKEYVSRRYLKKIKEKLNFWGECIW